MTPESDEEIVEKEFVLEGFVGEQKEATSVDDVDMIIEEVIAATGQMESDLVESDSAEDLERQTIVTESVATKSDDIQNVVTEHSPAATDEVVEPLSKVQESSVFTTPEDESMTIEEHLKLIPDGVMLPYLTSAEPTKIKFCDTIEIRDVEAGDWYKKNLPSIDPTDKGKKAFVEPDSIQSHPAREQFQLICGDIDFLVLLRENVISEVNSFFHSFIMSTLNAMRTVKDIMAKVENMLSWAEIDSIETALHRRLFIIAKYREVLLCKFVVARRTNIVLGLPTTAIDQRTLDLFQEHIKRQVCTEVLRYSMFGCLKPVSRFTVCSDIVPVGPVTGALSMPRRVFDNASYRIQILDSVPTDFFSSPHHQSYSSTSSMHFSDDIVHGTTTASVSTPTADQFSLPPAVTDSFTNLRTTMSRIISLQSKESRRLANSHSEVLDKIKQVESTTLEAFYQQNQSFHRLLTSIRQEGQNDTTALSLGLKVVRTQTTLISHEQTDARKEAKEQKAIITDMDERLATLRGEQLDFRAQAQENYNNLSSQLDELVAYINRGNDKKGERSSSRRPQPPPDDQNRPSGGNVNKRGGGGGSSTSGRRDDRRSSTMHKESGSSSVRPGFVFKINPAALFRVLRAKRQRFDKLARRRLDVATGTSCEDFFACVCRLVVQLRADANAGQRSCSLRLVVVTVACIWITSCWRKVLQKPADGFRRTAGGRFDDVSGATSFC
ncbi:nitrate transporter 1.7 [Dorcoceras hygrometricum]|nr:nitrate transporter 1.7 [Dorcoceras hygrometricum]